jgi:hypothetical protein
LPSGDPNRADAYFYPVAEDIEDAYYAGYNIIAYLIDGTKEDVWIGHAKPTTTDRAHGTVHCGPYKLVAITVQLRTLKGAGFRCSNFRLVHTIEGRESVAVLYIRNDPHSTSSTHVRTHKLLQICSQAVDKLCSHCLFPVVVTSSE